MKRQATLRVAGGSDFPDQLTLLVLEAQGRRDGPRVAIFGGVHGDEYEGVTAASFVWQDINVDDLSGSVVVIPVCNPPALAAGTRTSPIDGRNLARTFPGHASGAITERIADVLSREVIHTADYLIDLHSAGQHYAMPLLAGCYAASDDLGRRCAAAALAFGAPVYWAHPDIAPGRSLSVAVDADIPSLYVECGGGGRVRAADLAAYRLGVRRVLAHLGCLPPMAPSPPPSLRLRSTGDLDTWLSVTSDGVLLERVSLLESVKRGQTLGVVVDPNTGDIQETLAAPFDGVVIMARRTARVRPGDGAYMVALPDSLKEELT
jgi:predicted deacylase